MRYPFVRHDTQSEGERSRLDDGDRCFLIMREERGCILSNQRDDPRKAQVQILTTEVCLAQAKVRIQDQADCFSSLGGAVCSLVW